MTCTARGCAALTVLLATGCFRPNPFGVDTDTETAGPTSGSDSTVGTGPTDPTQGSGTTTSDPTATTDTTASTDSASSTGAPQDCDSSAGESDCVSPAPHCVDDLCQPCADIGGDGYCGDQGGDTPTCHPDGGQCETCVQDEDCGGDTCNDAYACTGCTAHSDCGETACDLASGSCIDTELVYWVDGTDCGPAGPPSSDPGFGSENQPYCWMSTALDQVGAGQSAVIRVSGAAGTQADIDVSDRADRTLAFLAEGEWVLGDSETPLTASNGNRVFVHGARVEGASGSGLRCETGGSLWISEATITDSAIGVSANGCAALVLERTQVQQSDGNAVDAADSDVRVLASMLVRNGASDGDDSALRLQDSTFEVAYSTIVGNLGADERASVYCSGSGGGAIRSSIILAPSLSSLDCPSAQVTNSAVDDDPADSDGNALVEDYDSTWFVDLTNDDAHLTPGPTPFEDVARWERGDPRNDFDGEQRLSYPGIREFAGADQP